MPQSTIPQGVLLSLCIPTFNRAELLDLCLATVLPQVATFADEVECVVSDNASDDATAEVIAAYAKDYPIRAYRNERNLGLIGNLTQTATRWARGRYVLMIGDDDTLVADSLGKVLERLRDPDAPDLIALNVGYLARDERPTAAEALGGIRAAPRTLLRHRPLPEKVAFEDLLEGPCVDLTAIYGVVLRRQMWLEEFPEPYLDEPFVSVRTTYPHTWIIAQRMPGKIAGAVADPIVITYEVPGEEFSWAKYRAVTLVLHATALLKTYESQGVPFSVLKPYYRFQLFNRGEDLGELLWNPDSVGGVREALRFAWMLRGFPLGLLKAFAVAMMHRQAPQPVAGVLRFLMRLKQRPRRQPLSCKALPHSDESAPR